MSSVNFAAFSATTSVRKLRQHLSRLPGLTLGELVTDRITETWIDFEYCGHRFAIHSHFGQFWFFVEDAAAPAEALADVVSHVVRLLGPRRRWTSPA